MITLATIVCIAHGLDVECKRDASMHASLSERLSVGRAYVEYIKQSDPLYVAAYCIRGGLT